MATMTISMDKAVVGGWPVIGGTRIPVSNIAGYFYMGYTPEEAWTEFPSVDLETVRVIFAVAERFRDLLVDIGEVKD